MATNCLEALKATGTLVVADTGEFDKLRALKPEDATTNPSLINAAARLPEYAHIVDEACAYALARGGGDEKLTLELALDRLAVGFGAAIAALVPGYISTEVDARLSFDAAGSVSRALRIIAMYEEAGVPRERVLIKLATTWECSLAAAELRKVGIKTNMTLLFSFAQAVIAAQAGATLISPFVGRIMDWWKAKTGTDYASLHPSQDPGVQSVSKIYAYYKRAGIDTIVMGASFRNVGEITELAGVDRVTVSPALLEKLAAASDPVPAKLTPAAAAGRDDVPAERITMSEAQFRWALNEDAMASEKLGEGIRNFAADLVKLEAFIAPKLAALRAAKGSAAQ